VRAAVQVQLYFARDRFGALAEADPSLRERQPFKAYLERDMSTMMQFGKKGLLEVGLSSTPV